MRYIVTGGAGFIGTNLIKRLINDGHDVVSLDNYSTGLKKNEQKGCDYRNVDLGDTTRKSGGFIQESYGLYEPKVDVIFHLAALPRIQASFENPNEVFKSNVISTQNILDWAKDKDIPVVFAGTSSIHGDKYANPYTFTKWQSELMFKMYHKLFNVRMSICRFYNVYGPNMIYEGPYSLVIPIFENQFFKNEPLTITDDGEQRRDFTHVNDIVDGLIKCGDRLSDVNFEQINGLEFEFGCGKNYSINELANMFGESYPKKYIPARDGEMRETLCESKIERDLLNWEPTHDLETYIKTLIGDSK
jgi:UDP-glucose 4-epimerase|tara:strand:+ start:251 stop:1159 length:909 start_codon:yes stop_codon:yes gene_type:complete